MSSRAFLISSFERHRSASESNLSSIPSAQQPLVIQVPISASPKRVSNSDLVSFSALGVLVSYFSKAFFAVSSLLVD